MSSIIRIQSCCRTMAATTPVPRLRKQIVWTDVEKELVWTEIVTEKRIRQQSIHLQEVGAYEEAELLGEIYYGSRAR